MPQPTRSAGATPPVANLDRPVVAAIDRPDVLASDPSRSRAQAALALMVPIQELLTDSFVCRHTRFHTLEALIRAGEARATIRGAAAISLGEDWNVFIRSVSRHSDWPMLLHEACGEWQLRRLGLVIDT